MVVQVSWVFSVALFFSIKNIALFWARKDGFI
jgi:hypothetical protein